MAATNYIWTGSDGASWTHVKNWVNSATNKLASAAPGGNSLDTVTINVGASTYPTLSSSVTLASVTINAHGKLTVATGGSLTADGTGASAIFNAGLITLSGGRIAASASTGGIANSGLINVTAASSISLGSGGALANTGQLDVSAGVLTVTGLIVNSAAINLSGGALTDATAIVNGAAATISGAGALNAITICFMAGTMIRTPEEERAIETLKRGDLVVTTDGMAKKICWLGRQTISSIFADPVRSWPIRIKAGALGENWPSRDLLLSPDHAVLIEGAMIHAGALVNGSSILRETRVPRNFVYYHIELEDHSLIFAENTPAETFIDNAERLAFDNWDEHQRLYPAAKEIQELPYPRAKAPRQVPVRIRIMLARNAQLLGQASSSGALAAAAK